MSSSNSGYNLCTSLFMHKTVLGVFFLLKKLCLISPSCWWILSQHRTCSVFLPYPGAGVRGGWRVSTNQLVFPWKSQAREFSSGEKSEVEYSRGNQEVRDNDFSLTRVL